MGLHTQLTISTAFSGVDREPSKCERGWDPDKISE